jgi:hypothetical protein
MSVREAPFLSAERHEATRIGVELLYKKVGYFDEEILTPQPPSLGYQDNQHYGASP